MRQYVYWIRGRQFAEYAALSIETVKKVDPFMRDRRIIVCTDEHEPDWAELVASFGTGVELREVRSLRPTIFARLDAQIDVLMNAEPGAHVLFLDADALLQQAFPFDDAHDLFVTWRDQVNGDKEIAKRIPYNGGVLGARVTPASIEAFIWLRARMAQMTAKNQEWNGDQLALADLLGAYSGSSWNSVIRWALMDCGTTLKVRALPCEKYNYSPNEAGEDVKDKVIVHLKGNRKDLIEHYAKVAA